MCQFKNYMQYYCLFLKSFFQTSNAMNEPILQLDLFIFNWIYLSSIMFWAHVCRMFEEKRPTIKC
jgi:hypothetical protein